ncbi:hypothetical protein EJ110_NYTH34258 [Nymphaea thermarum]|nr:hypothetical protein EJ110_NYTH34258 [Nymphaea thermarum]
MLIKLLALRFYHGIRAPGVSFSSATSPPAVDPCRLSARCLSARGLSSRRLLPLRQALLHRRPPVIASTAARCHRPIPARHFTSPVARCPSLVACLPESVARLTFVARCSVPVARRRFTPHVSRSSPAPSAERSATACFLSAPPASQRRLFLSTACLSAPVASCQFFVGLLFCTLIFFSALSAVALATSIAADHSCRLCEANTSSFVSSEEMKSSPFSSLITKMNGGNYEMWAMQMKRTLIAHDNEHLILEPKPVQKVGKYTTWFKDNSLVMVWIVGTLSQDIANEVLHKESAKDMWDSLAATYSQARNETRIMQLHHDIHQMRQDGRPLHTYYSSLKSMFERLNSYFPACKCEQQKAYRDMLMVGVFLSGLDLVYESAKNQMLTSPSIPPIDEAYNRLSRIPIPAATVPDTTSAMLATRGRGGSFFARGRGGRGRGNTASRPVCQFCHRIGHTVDKCWQKHGRPAFAHQTASTESLEQPKAQPTAPSSELRVDDLLSQLRSLIGDRPQHAPDPTTSTITTAASASSSGMYSAYTVCPATDTTD